jgi:hypothetical protein
MGRSMRSPSRWITGALLIWPRARSSNSGPSLFSPCRRLTTGERPPRPVSGRSSSRRRGVQNYAVPGERQHPAQLRSFLRVLRRGQPAFRRNLLTAYDRKCCISGWAPENVLEAAHIEEHSVSGLNSVGNGLLLRSDLHALFDDGLLRIDPERLVVVLAHELEGTPYWELNGQRLRLPVRGEGPRRDLLLARWRSSPR